MRTGAHTRSRIQAVRKVAAKRGENRADLRYIGNVFVDLKIHEGTKNNADQAGRHDPAETFSGYAKYFAVLSHVRLPLFCAPFRQYLDNMIPQSLHFNRI